MGILGIAYAKRSLKGATRGSESGKSGGARVIYLYLREQQITVLVTLSAKAKKSDLSRSEENELRILAAEIRSALGA